MLNLRLTFSHDDKGLYYFDGLGSRPRVPATPTYIEGLVIFAALTYRMRSAPNRHGLFAVYLTESRW